MCKTVNIKQSIIDKEGKLHYVILRDYELPIVPNKGFILIFPSDYMISTVKDVVIDLRRKNSINIVLETICVDDVNAELEQREDAWEIDK